MSTPDRPATTGLDIAAFITAFFAPVIGLVLGIVGVRQGGRRGGASGLAVAAVAISTVQLALAVITGIVVAVLLLGRVAQPSAPPPSVVLPETPADPVACSSDQVQVTAVTDMNLYEAGVMPMLSLTIVNLGSAPCALDVGTAAQQYIITSGSDVVWSSRDCQTGATSLSQVLEPGVLMSTTPFTWDRTRSSPGTCSGSRPTVAAGPDGPSYRLEVAVGEIESEPVAFRLF
jgi:hypothetical protein